MSINSCEKGKRGEREAAEALKALGIPARRAQQFSGANGDADLVCEIDGVHLEVKMPKRFGSWDVKQWMLQAAEGASKKNETPVALIKLTHAGAGGKGNPWTVILHLDDLPEVARAVVRALPELSDDTGPLPMDGSPG